MVKIRPFSAPDLDSLYEIDQEAFPPDVAYSYLELQHYVQSRFCKTIVAADDRAGGEAPIVGFVIGAWEPPDLGHIITIEVVPHWQRQQIGGLLLENIESWLWENGAGAIYLECSVEDQSALSFYDKHGYFILERLDGYYAEEHDAFVLMKTARGGAGQPG
ncbi:MAG TPA: N-acetyltransferase [Blastocatellia bacterium]|jgi:ribosomal protein S18 acetylase RimI-like enzyme|nr:N-acetyltransferase [Blastocatellia bacterium]